jgi:hypothetical protein
MQDFPNACLCQYEFPVSSCDESKVNLGNRHGSDHILTAKKTIGIIVIKYQLKILFIALLNA